MSFLYTIVPPEEVWADDENPPGQAVELVESSWHGVPVLARRTANGMVLERLLTTDPYAYLQPELSPGYLMDPKYRE